MRAVALTGVTTMADYTEADLARARSWARDVAPCVGRDRWTLRARELACLIASVRAEGRRAGLEEAGTKVSHLMGGALRRANNNYGFHMLNLRNDELMRRQGLERARDAIRALADKPASGAPAPEPPEEA